MGVYKHGALQPLIQLLESKSHKCRITFEEFEHLSQTNNFLKRVIEANLVIPEYVKFAHNFEKVFAQIKHDPDSKYTHGVVASYIPPLAKASPDWFASAFCSTDGQFSQLGDHDKKFSIQSVGKVFAYAMLHNLYLTKGKIE